MRLVELYVDGFGTLHDYHLGPSELAAGLTVIYGPNEAGKSTLLAFIRAILFGFRQRGEPAPEALAGGRLGGHLVFESRRGGQYRVERTAGGRQGRFRLVLPDGSETGEGALAARVLQNLSYPVYKNVFAFGMDELRRLENLKQDEIGAYIYGAGTGVEPGKLNAAAARLRMEMDALFTPRGRTVPELNRLAAEITDAEAELRQLRDLPARYRELKEKLAAGQAYREVLCESRRALQTRLAFLEKLIAAGPVWQVLGEARSALAELPAVDSFPESGVVRLEALEEKVHDAAVARDGYREQMDRCAQEMKDLDPDPALLAAADEVLALAEERSLLESLISEVREAEARARQAHTECAAGIEHLGPGWDKARLLGLDMSIVVRGQVESHRETLAALHARETALQDDVRRLAEGVGQRARLRDAAREALDQHRVPEAPVEAPPAVREEMLDRLEVDLRRLAALQADHTHLNERRGDLATRLAALKRPDGAPGTVLPVWLAPAVLVFVLAAAGAALLLEPLAAVFTLLVGLPAAAAAEMVRRQSRDRQNRAQQNRAQEQQELEALLAEIARDLDRVAAQMETVAGAVREAALTALGTETATETHIPAARRQLAAEGLARHRHATLAENLAAAETELERAREDERARRGELEAVRAERAQAADRWAAWLEKAGFDAGLEPAVALSFMEAAGRALERVRVLDEHRREAESLARRVRELIEQANRLAQTLGLPAVETGNAGPALLAMRTAVEGARAQERRKRTLGEEYERLQGLWRGKMRELERWDRDIRALLEAAGAADREDFRHRAAVYAERCRLRETIAAREREISVLAGSGQDRERLVQALSTGYPEAFTAERQEVRAELEALEQEQQDLDQEIGRRGEQIAALETGEQLAVALQQREMRRTRFNRQAREWRVRALALALLERAKEKYERERQPAVLAWASQYLQPMTGGRYQRVVAPVGQAARLEVERSDGVRLEAGQLSRGTAAQLFLAVRLALARQLAETSGRGLPLILDDILVDFDGERLEGAAGVLGRVAATRQVILFTCHRHIREVLTGTCPGAAALRLEQG